MAQTGGEGHDIRFSNTQHDPDLVSDSLSLCSNMTIAMYFALLLCSASQACTECCLEVTAVKQRSNVSWAIWVSSSTKAVERPFPHHG